MNNLQSYCTRLKWIVPLCAITLLSACGGKDDVLGSSGDAALAPSITHMSPAGATSNVLVYKPMISVTFNEAVTLAGSGASFVLSCAAPCTNPPGAVTVDNSIATFTPFTDLMAMTQYTATISGAKSIATGLALPSPYSWSFTTGAAATALKVTAVAPSANSTGVAMNIANISADFNETIAPLNGTENFTLTCALPCINPTGSVARNPSNRVASFTLSSGLQLEPMTTYTATLSGIRSLVTNAPLAAPFVWTFMTGGTTDTTRPRE